LFRVAAWEIWRIRRPVMLLVLAVDIAALLVPLLSPWHIAGADVTITVFLASLSVSYSVLTRRWERARRVLHSDVEQAPIPTPNLLASWCFPAAVLLPPPLAALVIVIAAGAEWPSRNIGGQARPYRYVYSSAGIVFAAIAAHHCSELMAGYGLRLLSAGVAYELASATFVVIAILTVGETQGLSMFRKWRIHQIELGTMAIAFAELALLHYSLSTLAWLSLPATMALQRHAVRAGLRAAEDPAARPMNQEAWLLVAREVIAACPVGAVMRVDTTDPAAVNYLARVQAGCDAIGMVGNSGLAVLLTDCPGTNADALAVRLRAVLHRQGIPAQVAVAAKPRDGQSLDDLLAVSEAELIARVAATRPAKSDSPEA
jgi:hypothetical protein